MITKFIDFLNENDDIHKRLSDRLNRTLDRIKSKYPSDTYKLKPEPEIKIEPEIKPEIKKNELTLKPKKGKFEDDRLNDAFVGLVGMGFSDGNVIDFLKRLNIHPETTVGEIVQFGIQNLRSIK